MYVLKYLYMCVYVLCELIRANMRCFYFYVYIYICVCTCMKVGVKNIRDKILGLLRS